MTTYISYARLSKDEDGTGYTSIEQQHNITTRFIRENLKWDGKIIYLDDNDYSGYDFNRPNYKKAIKIIEEQKGNAVFVTKEMSRFGRNQARILDEWDRLYELGVRIIFINENIDSLLRPDIRKILGIYAWEKESAVRAASESVTANFRERQLRGDLIIKVPYGYHLKYEIFTDSKGKTKKRNFKVIVDENVKDIIVEIFNLYINGFGYRKIAEIMTQKGYPTPSMYKKEINASPIWSNQIVSKIIKNDFYIGTLTCLKTHKKLVKGKSYRTPVENQIKHENHHEAIIDKETFELAQKISQERNTRKIKGTQGRYIHLFSGKVFCDKCKKNYICYKCHNEKTRKRYICGTKHKFGSQHCNNKNVFEDELIDSIRYHIQKKLEENSSILKELKNKTKFINKNSNLDKEINNLQNLIRKKKISIEKTYEDKRREEEENLGIVPIEILIAQLKKLTSELKNLENKLEELQKLKANDINQQKELEKQNQLFEKFLKITLTKKEIELLIDKIIIKNQKENYIDIYFNF